MTKSIPPIPSLVMIGFRAEAAPLAQSIEGLARVASTDAQASGGLAAIRAAQAEFALLNVDHEPDAILELTRQIAQQTQCIPIVVSADRHPDNIIRAMRAGARDFAHMDPAGEDVARAIRDLLALRPAQTSAQGKVIAAFGCKGGSGATTLALNLAASLLNVGDEPPRKVLVIDLDPERGDALIFLDLTTKYGFRDLLANSHRLDTEMLLTHSLPTHASGLRVLAHTEATEEGHWLGATEFGGLLSFVKGHFDFIVVDGVRDFRELSLVALDGADHILCTMTQDIPSLKNAGRCDKVFRALGYSQDKVRLVVNRYRSAGPLTTEAIADALGRRVDATVANDFPAVVKSINEGRLLVERDPASKVAKDIRALVPLFHEVAAPKRRSLFARWGK